MVRLLSAPQPPSPSSPSNDIACVGALSAARGNRCLQVPRDLSPLVATTTPTSRAYDTCGSPRVDNASHDIGRAPPNTSSTGWRDPGREGRDRTVPRRHLKCGVRPGHALDVVAPAPGHDRYRVENDSSETRRPPLTLVGQHNAACRGRSTPMSPTLARYRRHGRQLRLTVNVGYAPQRRRRRHRSHRELAGAHRLGRSGLRLAAKSSDIDDAGDGGDVAVALRTWRDSPGRSKGRLDRVRHFYDLGVRTMAAELQQPQRGRRRMPRRGRSMGSPPTAGRWYGS